MREWQIAVHHYNAIHPCTPFNEIRVGLLQMHFCHIPVFDCLLVLFKLLFGVQYTVMQNLMEFPLKSLYIFFLKKKKNVCQCLG